MKTINLKKIAFAGAALIGLGTAAITTVNQNTEPTTVQAASSKIKVSQSTAVKKSELDIQVLRSILLTQKKKETATFTKSKASLQLENTT